MEKLVALGLSAVKDLGAEFGEVRVERRVEENIRTKNLEVEVLSRRETAGIGIRVLYRGAWDSPRQATFRRKGCAAPPKTPWPSLKPLPPSSASR